MAKPPKHPYPSTFAGAVELDEPYHDYPSMMPLQVDDFASPPLRSPPSFNNPDAAAAAPHLSFRSSVPLIPTPGTISKRHPSYVRPFGWMGVDRVCLIFE